MNNKKKQTAVAAMATVLSVTSIASPLPVMAQENDPAPLAIMQDENQQKKTAPEIVLPKNLQAMTGTALEEIPLPEHWDWVENSTVITEETAEYPARFSVDDVTYDYSNVEGYNAEGHYVERMVVITVEPEKSEQAEPAEPVQGKANRSLEDTPTTLNAGDIVIDETNFPDEGFRNWLKAQPYGTDGTIYKTEIAGITKIDVSGNTSIKDLTGIEHLTALTHLYCNGTGIKSLDVSTNTALTDLYCYENRNLTRLTLSGATALKNLNCSYTGIGELDVSTNTALTFLNCSTTGIKSLDVGTNTKLEDLKCKNTEIISLDVSKNTFLTTLDCYYNRNQKNLKVEGAKALTTLDCAYTGITSLDVSKNTALTDLHCYNTGIESLDVSTNTALTNLYCFNTGIESLDVSNNTKLTTLECYGNASLENLTVDGAIALTTLDCYVTGITSLDVSKNTKLTSLYCYRTGITSLDVSKNTFLTTLNCNNTGITSIDVSKNAALTALTCDDTSLAYLNIGTNNNLRTINKRYLKPVSIEITDDTFSIEDQFAGIDVNKVSNVSGADYENGVMSNYSIGKPITYTYACGSSVYGAETIDVTLMITKGIEINADNFPDEAFRNYIADNFDEDKNGSLFKEEIAKIITIDVKGNNKIKDLTGIEHFTALTALDCSNIGITNLNVNNNTKLTTLDCSNTGITSLNVNNNTKLTTLDCSNTGITSLNVNNNTKLTTLDCSNTGITSLNVNNNTKLTTSDCSNTGIASLNMSANTVLEYLNCSETPLAYLNIGTNNNLTTVIKDNLKPVKDLDGIGDTFNIADKFAGIDVGKVNVTSGADYNKLTGEMSNYKLGTPIIYTYNCGTSSSGTVQTISVSLTLKGDLEINADNFPDEAFRNYIIANSDTDNNKTLSKNEIANTPRIFVSGTADIKDLTGIEHFTALSYLDCSNTGITSLNVNNNTKLMTLDCSNTGITSLDVSKHTALESLSCNNTGIESLDVSKHTALTFLNCSGTPLAYLNIGTNNNLNLLFKDNLKPLNIEITDDTINMADKFTGIDVGKVSNVKGANYNKGVMSNYSAGTPITYTYACGTSSGGTAQTIDVTLNLTDTKAESTISIIDDLDKTYDGKAVSAHPMVDTTGSSGEVSYKWERKKNVNDWEDIVSAPTDAGTYRVTATLASDSDYKGATSTPVEFTISQAESTISITADLSKAYDGKAVSANPTVSKTGSSGAVSYKWERKKNTDDWEDIASAPTDAGTYRVTATLASDSNYKGATSAPVEFTIAQVESTISITADLSKAYDGKAVSANPAVSKTGSSGAVSYKWEHKKNANDWEVIASAPTDAGTYRVTAILEFDSNYKGVTSAPVEFTISQAESTISITVDLSKAYDSKAVSANPAVSKTGSSGAVSYKWEHKKNADDWEVIASAPTDAGTYRVTATLASDSNYKGATAVKEFTISQATNSWTDKLSITGWTYGETANNPVAAAKFGTADYLYSNSKNGTYKDIIPTNAGTWYVKAVVESTDNYKGLESDAVKFEIKKAKAPAISLPANLSGVYDTKLSAITLPAGWAWVDGDVKLTASNAGYKARLTVDDSNYDYTGTEGYNSANHYVERTLTVTISKAENIWTQEPVIAGWTYGETASEPTATAKYGAVTFLYSDSENGTFTPDKPTNAGTWYMKAVVNATDDYTGLNEVISFTIAQAEPSYTVPQDLKATFGQTLADVTLPAGFSWTDAAQAVGNAGTNTFTAVFTPDDTKNYKTVKDISITLTIKKADNALTNALSLEGWTYGDTPAGASAGFRFGKPRFLYSDRADGTYTKIVPTNAGTWYVKAVVEGTDNYEGAESNPVSFVIAPRNTTENNQIIVPDITADTNLDELVIKDGDKVLEKGTDYDVAKTQDGNKVTVTISFKGNYTGTIIKTYTVASSGGDKDNNKPDNNKSDNQNTDDKKAVQTGDTTSVGLWSSILAFSAGIAVFLNRKKQKKETEE